MPDGDLIYSATFDLDVAPLLRATDPRPVLEEAGNRKVSRMVRGMRTSGAPAAGQPPVSRRGARGFAGRFAYEIVGGGSTLRYGNASRQARLLALGGVIRPRTAKALTIPIAPEAEGKRAKDFPDLFRIGNCLFIKKSRGRGSKGHTELTALFALKKSVTIRPHPWGYKWDQQDNKALLKSLQRRAAKES